MEHVWYACICCCRMGNWMKRKTWLSFDLNPFGRGCLCVRCPQFENELIRLGQLLRLILIKLSMRWHPDRFQTILHRSCNWWNNANETQSFYCNSFTIAHNLHVYRCLDAVLARWACSQSVIRQWQYSYVFRSICVAFTVVRLRSLHRQLSSVCHRCYSYLLLCNAKRVLCDALLGAASKWIQSTEFFVAHFSVHLLLETVR